MYHPPSAFGVLFAGVTGNLDENACALDSKPLTIASTLFELVIGGGDGEVNCLQQNGHAGAALAEASCCSDGLA